MRKGGRLSHVVVELEGNVMRDRIEYVKGKGLVRRLVEEPAGFLVYFPKGHVLRLDAKELAHHGLDKKPTFVDMRGLQDPNSALGSLLLDQDEDSRALAWEKLEDQVIALATVKTGKLVMPEMIKHIDEHEGSTVRRKKKRVSQEHKMRKVNLKESA